MSALAVQARAKAKEKVERLTRSNTGKIDASGWKEPLGEMAGVQTGPRPISRRQFRRGGKVHGEHASMHAGRKPRASGGGGWKAGTKGYEDHAANQKIHVPNTRSTTKQYTETSSPTMAAARKERASGGMTADGYINRNVKEANESREGEKHVGGMKKGGRAHKATGGNMTAMALPQAFTPVARAEGGRTHGAQCHCAKCGGGAVAKAAGGPVYGGTRPEGGRIARASGGRSKKAMNVNIIIAPSGGAAKPAMPIGPMPPPPGGPPGMHQGLPPPPPPGGAPPPMSPSPMMRKHGGRAYPIEHGAGGGKGRLEKARAYGG